MYVAKDNQIFYLSDGKEQLFLTVHGITSKSPAQEAEVLCVILNTYLGW